MIMISIYTNGSSFPIDFIAKVNLYVNKKKAVKNDAKKMQELVDCIP